MSIIRKIDFESEKHELLSIIRRSFITVADEFGLSEENASSNPAFLTIERLEDSIRQGVEFYLLSEEENFIGCVGIQPGRERDEYYIERLGVLPEYRHRGAGEKLLEYAISVLKRKNCRKIGIGIIDENTVLKQWYLNHGFRELGIKRFEHLPFTVRFMDMQL